MRFILRSPCRAVRRTVRVAGARCAMTTPLLDLDGRVVDRRQELTELRAAVDAAERVGGGCVLLSGAPGVGKSTLTQAFGVEVSQRNCVFAYGRCRDGAPAPYSALGDALSSIVRTMEATGPAERDRWRADLVSGMSALAGVLGELVPDLAEVLGEASHVADLDAADARRRLHRAAIRLVSDTASYRPVVLAIDDLQWADRDTLLLLSELLTVSLRNVLVLGAHRAGEFDPGQRASTPPASAASSSTRCRREDVEELLAAVCGRAWSWATSPPNSTIGPAATRCRSVSCCTARNEKARSPRPAPGGRPSWDLRVLTSIEVTATAAEFLGRYLDQLRPIDREVLSSLACIGGEFDLDDATAAAAQPPDVVAQALWSALELRLLEAVDSGGRRITNAISRDARYRFSHDRVAEAARVGLSDDDQRERSPADRSTAGRAGGRPAVRGRPPRRHRRPRPGRRRRAHPVRRGAAARGAEGSGAGIVPAGPRVLPKRSGPARRAALGRSLCADPGAAARRRGRRPAGRRRERCTRCSTRPTSSCTSRPTAPDSPTCG